MIAQLLEQIRRAWWLLWTGHESREAVRHKIEEDARRFGATRIEWGD